MNTSDGVWLSISDYSRYKKVSVSTIRRHIKSKIIKHKEENGKYLIYVSSADKLREKEDAEVLKLKLEVEELKIALRALQEDNNELVMLVDLYEKQISATKIDAKELPPELPSLI